MYGSNAEAGNRRTARSASAKIAGFESGIVVSGQLQEVVSRIPAIVEDAVDVDVVTDLGPAVKAHSLFAAASAG